MNRTEQGREILRQIETTPRHCVLCGSIVSALELSKFNDRQGLQELTIAIHAGCAGAIVESLLNRPAEPTLIDILAEAASTVS